MASLNEVFLAGNLTRDPEVRFTASGTAVAQLGLAVNRKFKNKDGQMQDDVVFVDIEVWGKQAEICAKYLSKGSSALVKGRLKFDQWEKDGVKKSKLKVVGGYVQFLGGSGNKTESKREVPPNDDIPF